MKFTKKFIDDLKVTGKDYFLWDTELPGFGIKVSSAGRKTFVLQYRDSNKNTKRISLGVYPALHPQVAKEKALVTWSDIHKGIDPSRKSPAGVLLFKELWEDYKNHLKDKQASLKTLTIIDHIEKHYIIKMYDFEVNKITRKVILDVLKPLNTKRILRASTLAFIKAAFNLGLMSEKTQNNPAQFLKKDVAKKRVRWLSEDESKRLLDTLENWPKPHIADIYLFLYYTGARSNEVKSLTWDHIDLKNKTWLKPASLTKQKSSSYIPLLEKAIEILNRQDKERNLVFETKTYLMPDWLQITKKAGITDFRIHDLRHNFASMLVSKGVSLEIIGQLLGHSSYQTTKRYAHLSHTALKEALEKLK